VGRRSVEPRVEFHHARPDAAAGHGSRSTSDQARRAVSLVRDRVTWQGCGPQECDGNAFFEGEIEPCINGQVGAVGAYFGQDIVVGEANRGIVDRLLAEQLSDGGWNCEAPTARRGRRSTPRSACLKPCSNTNGPSGAARR